MQRNSFSLQNLFFFFSLMARERRSSSFLALLMVVFLLSLLVSAGLYLIQASPEFKPPYERIDIYANKVQPLGDSCEQYPYFDLPFCPPEEQRFHSDRKKSLQDILAGDCFSHTQYLVFFLNDSDMVTLCEKNLTRAEVAKFRNAIQRKFEYQFAFENLFMRGMVGRISEEENCNVSSRPRYYLVTHIQFYVSYSEGRVKQISIINDNNYDVDVTEDTEIMNIKFTYSVYWDIVIDNETKVLLNQLTPEVDEWFVEDYRIWKIISFLMFWPSVIVIWVGLLLAVTLPKFESHLSGWPYFHGDEHSQKKDISPYIHGDTCSCPHYTFFLGAIIGTGTQLFIMLCIFIYFAFHGIMYPCNLKATFSKILQTYFYSSVFAAYKTTAFHGSFSFISWKESIYLTGAIYFFPFFLLITLVLNFLATAKFVIPFTSELGFIVQDLVIWAFLTCILLSVGSSIAHFSRSRQKVICPTRKLSREIHQQSLFLKTPVQMLLGGLIPFLILLPEMDNIYATLWNKKICGAVDTILYSFIYLITLTVPISVGFSHYEFYKQDYQWWWRSVFRGGSTAIYMFFYGFYFFSRTHIEQTLLVQLMCYNACVFYALFLILGTARFYASSLIFHYAYQLQKDE